MILNNKKLKIFKQKPTYLEKLTFHTFFPNIKFKKLIYNKLCNEILRKRHKKFNVDLNDKSIKICKNIKNFYF
jgi:hypothetical protein